MNILPRKHGSLPLSISFQKTKSLAISKSSLLLEIKLIFYKNRGNKMVLFDLVQQNIIVSSYISSKCFILGRCALCMRRLSQDQVICVLQKALGQLQKSRN